VPRLATHAPRPYLSAPRRRDHLLDAAGGLVRRGGWSALSMQGLAAAAGVSRQLVYEHFDTADDLYVATLTHLFERAYTATVAIVESGTGVDDTVRRSFAFFLDLPAEERHALRSLAVESEAGRPSLARARARLRNRIAAVWVPFVRQQTGLRDAESTALAWMLNTAAWGMSDTIADGTLARARAVDLFVRFVDRTLSAWRVKALRRGGTASRSRRSRSGTA
jgi:AcrR family transcriptional regulator